LLTPKKRLDRGPDIKLLQAFDAVQSSRSFRAAAERLKVSISAVSQAITLLELQLGGVLFDRAQRPIALTFFGQRYLPLAQTLINAAQNYQSACDDLLRSRQAEIRIGCVDSFAATVGPDLVKSLSGRTGSVILHSGITPHVLQQLFRHEIDVAICTDSAREQQDLHVEPLCQEDWVVVSAVERGWPAELTWETLAKLGSQKPFLRYSKRSIIGEQIDRFLTHRGIELPRRFEFDSSDSLLSLVCGGVGWAITSPLCLFQSLHHAQQVKISSLPASAHGSRTFYLLSLPKNQAKSTQDLAKVTRQILQHKTFGQLLQQLPALSASSVKVLMPTQT
jgi:DNA-binding transcriptional LysR family regulator